MSKPELKNAMTDEELDGVVGGIALHAVAPGQKQPQVKPGMLGMTADGKTARPGMLGMTADGQGPKEPGLFGGTQK